MIMFVAPEHEFSRHYRSVTIIIIIITKEQEYGYSSASTIVFVSYMSFELITSVARLKILVDTTS